MRTWSHPGQNWARAELTDRGDLIVVGTDVDQGVKGTPLHELGTYWRFSWDGAMITTARVSGHHDIELTPAGRLLLLTSRLRTEPSLWADGPIVEDRLTLLDVDGTPLDDVSLVDVLRRPVEGFTLQTVPPWQIDGQMRMDLTHANSVEWMARRHLFGSHALYDEDHVLLCMRHQNAIAIIDFADKKLVWAWGQDELEGPHDATLLDNGNILLFDNGVTRSVSRVVELNPRTRSIVWQYPPAGATPFFSLSMGAAQRLPNGNTLITDSNHSRAFEVTREGETVWEFINPDQNDLGMRSVITSMKRYPIEWVDAIIERHRG